MLPNLPRENLLELCRRMFVIRHFEENLVPLHDKGVFGGHYHLYVGQEATGVPALACLRADDYLFTTHRNHGHLLARGVEPKRLFAEILGRVDGLNKGKGGSFHSVAPAQGFLHSSGVVAGIIPLSTGTAYAAKAQKNGRITVCLFGDGSLEEGAAPEAFNIASLLKLPLLFLCENNGKYGISIGHKDTDNLLRKNQVRGNQQAGIYFRNESEGMAGHRNRIEENTIENNGATKPAPAIEVRGETHDLIFKNNIIRDTRPTAEQKQLIGIQLEEKVGNVTLDGNQIAAKTELADARKK